MLNIRHRETVRRKPLLKKPKLRLIKCEPKAASDSDLEQEVTALLQSAGATEEDGQVLDADGLPDWDLRHQVDAIRARAKASPSLPSNLARQDRDEPPPVPQKHLDSLRKHSAKLPAVRDTLPMPNEYSQNLTFQGAAGHIPSILAIRLVLMGLAHFGIATELRKVGANTSLVFSTTVGEFALMLDKMRGKEGKALKRSISSRYDRVRDAIESLSDLKFCVLQKNPEDGKDYWATYPVAATRIPAAIQDGSGKVEVAFMPWLLNLLQLNPKIARTILSLRDVHRLRTARAVTMLMLLSTHRHLWLQYKKPLVVNADRIRKLFDMEAEKSVYPTRQSKFAKKVPTRFVEWKEVMRALRKVAQEVMAQTDWRFKLDTVRSGKTVVGVRFDIKRHDKDFRNAHRSALPE